MGRDDLISALVVYSIFTSQQDPTGPSPESLF